MDGVFDDKKGYVMTLNKVKLDLGGGTLLQIANRSLTQMMSYIVDTEDGKTIIIDGGFYCEEDAKHLYEQIQQRGGCVDLWMITHAHSDHLGALLWLLERYPAYEMSIKKLCFHFPSNEWLSQKEEYDINSRFLQAVKEHNISVVTPVTGDIFTCGGVSVEILSHPENYEDYPQINPTSMVFRLHYPNKDILFLGDFDVNGQEEFLQKRDISKIRNDIVQMSHHGQGGVDRYFYELIQPKICLYTAPKWLWENNHYKCTDPLSAGKGPFTIMETRKWMNELGVQASYTHAEGDYLFW